MKARTGFTLALVFALAAPVAALAAGPEKAEKAASKMLEFEKALQQAGSQVDRTLAAMNALTTAGAADLVPKYKAFTKEVDNLEKVAAKARENAKAAASQRDAYLSQWQKSVDKLENPELKAAAQTRRAELTPKIEAIKSSLNSARDTFNPLMQNLRDLTLFLGNSLDPMGITSSSTMMTKCNEGGAQLKSDLERGITSVRDLAATIKPGGVART